MARLCICNDCLLFLPGPFMWISPSSLSLTALLLLSTCSQKPCQSRSTPGWSPKAGHHLLHPPTQEHRSALGATQASSPMPESSPSPLLLGGGGSPPSLPSALMMIQSTHPLQLLVTAHGPEGFEQGHGAGSTGLSRSLVTAESRTKPRWNRV